MFINKVLLEIQKERLLIRKEEQKSPLSGFSTQIVCPPEGHLVRTHNCYVKNTVAHDFFMTSFKSTFIITKAGAERLPIVD